MGGARRESLVRDVGVLAGGERGGGTLPVGGQRWRGEAGGVSEGRTGDAGVHVGRRRWVCVISR